MKKLIRFTEADGDKIHKAWLNHQAKTGKRISFNKWVTMMLIKGIDTNTGGKSVGWFVDADDPDDPDIPFV